MEYGRLRGVEVMGENIRLSERLREVSDIEPDYQLDVITLVQDLDSYREDILRHDGYMKSTDSNGFDSGLLELRASSLRVTEYILQESMTQVVEDTVKRILGRRDGI